MTHESTKQVRECQRIYNVILKTENDRRRGSCVQSWIILRVHHVRATSFSSCPQSRLAVCLFDPSPSHQHNTRHSDCIQDRMFLNRMFRRWTFFWVTGIAANNKTNSKSCPLGENVYKIVLLGGGGGLVPLCILLMGRSWEIFHNSAICSWHFSPAV